MTPRIDTAHRALVAVLTATGLTGVVRVPEPEAGPAWHDLAEDGVLLITNGQPAATVLLSPDNRRAEVRVHRVRLSTSDDRRQELVADVRIGVAP